MLFTFDGDVATKFGVDEAILFYHIAYWVYVNELSEKNFYEGRYWTFNSGKAYERLFPYWSDRQIRNKLQHLVEAGLIIKGAFSENKYDHTSWYTLTDLGKSVSQNWIFDWTKITNQSDKNYQSLNNTYNTIVPSTDNTIVPSKNINLDKNILSRTTENGSYADKAKDIIEYLNAKTGKHYSARSKATVDNIKARLREGFTVEDFKIVIDNKCLEWLNNPEMKKYLRPETLFRACHFDSYLNDVEDERQKRKREEQEINERQRKAIKDADIGIFDSV